MAVEIVVGEKFYPLFSCRKRYLVMMGGRGSSKTETAARIMFYRALRRRHRYLVMRKVRRTLSDSVVEVFRRFFLEQSIPFEYHIAEQVMAFKAPAGWSEILFRGIDEPSKIKSIKGITSAWLEETTEFSKDEFETIDLSVRESDADYLQIILTFNPVESEAPWLKERFFGASPDPDALTHRSTILDNPNREVVRRYLPILDKLKHQSPEMYQIARLGEWARPEGGIFDWPVEELPADMKYDSIFYGVDFGFSIDPAAVVKVYRRADFYWVEELVYEAGLTNADLAKRLKDLGVGPRERVYCDAAEPKSIAELNRLGIRALAAAKGQDSVRAGINFLRSVKIRIVQGSQNLYNEMRSYSWRRDRSGQYTAEPVDYKNHLIDATRYAITGDAEVLNAGVSRVMIIGG